MRDLVAHFALISIPLEKTIDIYTNTLSENNEKIEGSSNIEFQKLLSLATRESNFIFNGKLYKPVQGVVVSSVKWSDPGHFLESQGKFFLSFPCTPFYMFLTSKIMDETLKSFLGRSILHYYQIRNI